MHIDSYHLSCREKPIAYPAYARINRMSSTGHKCLGFVFILKKPGF